MKLHRAVVEHNDLTIDERDPARKDYRVTVKVRNNNILGFCEKFQITPPKLAKKIEINYKSVNDLINMTTSPFGKNGEIKEWVVRMLIFFNCSLSDLFSDEQYEAFENTTIEAEMSLEDVFSQFFLNPHKPSFEEVKEVKSEVAFALQCLTDRQRFVVSSLMGLEDNPASLGEVGETLDVTRTRVRMIFGNAQRKMRKELGIKVPSNDVYLADIRK